MPGGAIAARVDYGQNCIYMQNLNTGNALEA